MANKKELLAEAYKRGLLPPEKTALYEEMQRRKQPTQVVKQDKPFNFQEQWGKLLPPGVPGIPAAPDFSFMETAKNIPSSAYDAGKGIYNAFANLPETAQGMATLGKSALARGTRQLSDDTERFMTGTPQSGMFAQPKTAREMPIEAIAQDYKQKYGSRRQALKTLEQDPVGALLDASGALMGVGGLTKAPMLSKMGASLDPLRATAGALRKAGKLVPKDMPSHLYEGAAKFPSKADARKLVKTALKEGVMPTEKGLNKITTLVDDLNTGIDALVESAEATGKVIPAKSVFKYFKKLRQNLGGKKLEGGKDLKIINRVAKEFSEHMKSLKSDSLTPKEMQAFKKDAWKKIKWGREQMKAVQAKEEAYRAAGRSARESIEKLVPDIVDLNKREGALLELQKYLTPVASRIERRDLVGLGLPMKAASGGIVGGAPGFLAGVTAGILDAPKVKSGLALGLNNWQQAAKQPFMVDPNLTNLINQGLFQTGKLSPYGINGP